jgi:hypothetical protein
MLKERIIKDYRYIYNMEQVNFYILFGLNCDICGSGVSNGKAYIKFKDSKKLQEAFSLWMNKK